MSQTKYSCDECDKSFETPEKLGGHKVSDHPKKHTCDTCGEEFDSAASLGAHCHHHGNEYDLIHSNADLIAELERVKKSIGRTPSRREFNSESGISSTTYVERFGSWQSALRNAEMEPQQIHEVDRKNFLDAIRDLADELGHPPTLREMNSMGKYDSTLHRSKFDTWSDALEAAGLETRRGWPYEGREHNWWNGGDPDYGEGWTERKREAIRERDNRRCVSCGLTEKEHKNERGSKLHVHHIIPARQFDDPEDDYRNSSDNLVTLCHSCHLKWERIAPLKPIIS